MLEKILFLSAVILTSITIAVWPVMFMAHIVGAKRKGFWWSTLAIFVSALYWSVLLVILALLAKTVFDIDATDVEFLKRPETISVRMLPLHLLGLVVYTAFDALIYKLVLTTTFFRGIAISIGVHIVRIALVIVLVLIAVLFV